MMKRFEAVIFDMDGVIFDSELLVIKCWQVVADKYGIKNIEDTCHKCLGLNKDATKELMLGVYGADFPYDEYKQEMAEVFFSRAAGGKLAKKPGVEELLGYLREHEFKVGLASSTREALVRKELSEGGLIEYFDQIIGGDKVKRSKPEPDIFLEACSRLGSEPEKCYVIEDSYNGIRAAHAAGMHPIMVPDLMEATEEMRGLAEVVLESLKDVRKYFDKIIVV